MRGLGSPDLIGLGRYRMPLYREGREDVVSSNPEKPLVSVILPTHNRAELLARAVSSVIAQTYANWELIVVDDASTDHSRQVVYGFVDPRVYYVRLPVNCGHPARPRNIGWLLARGTYVAYIDDDNAWRPMHLERLVAAAEAHPEAIGAYGGRCHHIPDGRTEEIVDPDHGIDTGDALHRRDLIQIMPEMWSEENFTHEDVEFWGRLRRRHAGGLVWAPEVLSDYYIHAGNRYYSRWLNLRRYDSGYFSRNAAWLDEPVRWRGYVDVVTRLGARRVLDVGCGRGWLVRALRRMGVDAYGVDPSPALSELTVIREHFVRTTADLLPFPNAAFDAVLCTDTLAHIPEPFLDRSLREIARVCGRSLVLAIDCADPTREGHLTMRPRSWWLERLSGLGITPLPDRDQRMPGPPEAGLELIICDTSAVNGAPLERAADARPARPIAAGFATSGLTLESFPTPPC